MGWGLDLPLSYLLSNPKIIFMASNPKQSLSFLANNQSIASVISQLHQYFKDAAAYGQIDRCCLMDLLETVDEEQSVKVLNQIQKIDTEIALLKVLGDSLSIADQILHTRLALGESGLSSDVYKIPNRPRL
jgi:hypothetical protein